MAYEIDWVTGSIAVGMAPMSYDALDEIRAQGVSCILNLCAEFCDLHWIEVGEGFEVYYLPIRDECAPDPVELEKALDWADEAVYLGKKVLIHCRHGVGRTGTVATAYLLRRGLSRKAAARRLARARIGPANFCQWWFLRRFARQAVPLTIREPRLEAPGTATPVNLAPFLGRYEELLGELDQRLDAAGVAERCGDDHIRCCRNLVELSLVEAVHLNRSINSIFANSERAACVERAAEALRRAKPILTDRSRGEGRAERYRRLDILCPLNEYGACGVYDQRPTACRLADLPPETADDFVRDELPRELERLSGELLRAYAPQRGETEDDTGARSGLGSGASPEAGTGEGVGASARLDAGTDAGPGVRTTVETAAAGVGDGPDAEGAAADATGTGQGPKPGAPLRFTLPEVVSGRWVASFFDRFLKGGAD